jgi:Flp pilus assembly protein TadD
MPAPAPAPAALEATLQQALLAQRMGRLYEAEKLYREILRALPDHLGITNNLGIVLKDQGKLADAATTFRKVLARNANDPLAHINLGNVLRLQGQLEEAAACYRRAITLKPEMPLPHANLGNVLCQTGRTEESFASFRRHAELAYGTAASSAQGAEAVAPHKAAHDLEQRDYLARNPATAAAATATFHLEDGSRVSGRAVRADASAGEIAARWQTSRPQIVVIDNLLTEAALEKLRRFCWGSTVWRKVYPNGYLGALPEHGFACPLLAQIAEELRSAYPAILGDDPLLQLWGFKYDSALSGIAVHADFAAVNINFWITPDEANLDPDSGGLIVWDVAAPLDWGFAKYNDDVAAARDFLARSGAHPVKIPHRANRAVIFDSDLFHETDRIAFKDGYLNRRINITMLYGRREQGAMADHDH